MQRGHFEVEGVRGDGRRARGTRGGKVEVHFDLALCCRIPRSFRATAPQGHKRRPVPSIC